MVGPDPTIHFIKPMDPRLKAEDDKLGMYENITFR